MMLVFPAFMLGVSPKLWHAPMTMAESLHALRRRLSGVVAVVTNALSSAHVASHEVRSVPSVPSPYIPVVLSNGKTNAKSSAAAFSYTEQRSLL